MGFPLEAYKASTIDRSGKNVNVSVGTYRHARLR